jgi:hypothetical protein
MVCFNRVHILWLIIKVILLAAELLAEILDIGQPTSPAQAFLAGNET